MGDRLSARLRGLPNSLDGLSSWPGGCLLGLGTVVATLSCWPCTAIRHFSWVNGPYLTTGFSPGTPVSSPTKNHDKILKWIVWIVKRSEPVLGHERYIKMCNCTVQCQRMVRQILALYKLLLFIYLFIYLFIQKSEYTGEVCSREKEHRRWKLYFRS